MIEGGRGAGADRRRAMRAAVLMVSTALAGASLGAPAMAQPAPGSAQPAQAAAHNFNIPPQSLTDGLTLFGRQSGWQVSVHSDLIRGANTRGVTGTMPPRQALDRLLAGTGFTYTISDGNTVTLQKLPTTANGAMTLPPVQVEGQAQGNPQSPYGPGVGYVATQSVTGTKTDTPILETPQSISVVTRQQMDDQGAQTVDQALRYTSGVHSEFRGDQQIFDNDMLLRGFQPDQYLDGLKLIPGEFGIGSIDPYFLNRIEVLQGPASVLYGQGTPGGIVTMTSKLPTDQPYHEVELTGGSFGHINGGFDLSGPVEGNDQLLYRLTGIGLSTGSQIDYTHQDRFGIAPALTWKPDADTTLTLLGQYQHDSGPLAYGFVPAQGTVLPNPNGKISPSLFVGDPNYDSYRRDQAQIGYMFEHRFDDTWTFRQNFRYQYLNAAENNMFESGLKPDLQTLNRYSYADRETLNTITVDNQLQAKFRTGVLAHTALVGVDYQWNSFDQQFGTNVAVPTLNVFAPVYGLSIPAPATPLSASTQSEYQVGVYAQDQVKWNHWSLLLGGREDWAGLTNTCCKAGGGTTTNQFNTAFTYRVGLVYNFDNGIAPYVSYTTSFSPNVGSTFSGQAFVPTTGQQYEVGIKYQPPGRSSFITAAAYNLTEQNVLVTDPVNPDYQTQTGEARARGIELEGHASLTNNLNLIATYTYTDAINTKSTTTANTITGVAESEQGKPLVGVPSQMASLWANYTIHDGKAAGLGFGGGVRYVGSSPGDPVNSFTVPSATVFDAALYYDLGRINPSFAGLKFQINATNLFDKQYITHCTSKAYCSFGYGRTVYATLRYQW
ncbi:MAG TPA: TonB-dependent siderophore receptor [Stellaceae bacterium]|nr:TonB-dependent siderophore receptor [Stellaceae bacterium]